MKEIKVAFPTDTADWKLMVEKKDTNTNSIDTPLINGREELQNQLSFLQAIVEDSPGLLAVVDNAYCFVAFNKNYAQSFKKAYGVGLQVGMPIKEALKESPHLLENSLAPWKKALEGEQLSQRWPLFSDHSPATSGIYKPMAGADGLLIGAMFKGDSEKPVQKEQAEFMQEFILLADAMPQIVWTADQEGNMDFINSWAEKYTGASKKELLDGSWTSFIHPDDLTSYKARLQLFIESQEEFEIEYRLRDSKGLYRWHLGRGIPVRDKEKKVVKYIGTATDIHEHKRLLRRYELKARELEKTMEAIPQVVWTTEPDGRVIYFNRQWYQYTGSTPRESLNEAWLSAVHPEDVRRTKETWQHSLDSGKDYHIEYRLKRADGVYHWFIGKAVPLWDNEGAIDRWFGTCSDIQDQVLQRDELDQKNRKLYQINRYLDDFVHAVAHDLRSPVAGLKLSFELISQVDESKQEKIMRGCQTYLDKLDNTLQGLVQLIEVQEESQQQYYEPIDIHQVLDQVVMDLQQKLMDAGAAVKFKNLEWRTIIYPKPYIYNILRNIIRYALRFRDTSERLTFCISTRQTNDNLMLIEIKDNGPGINLEKEIKNLFKPFSHINKGSDKQGMGLAIVKHMVEKNGGKIEVKSKLGKGTRFKLYLKEYTNHP